MREETHRLIKDNKGAYTLETAIVFTVAFTAIMFLIFITFIMYEQARLNSVAQDAAERGAVIYAVKSKEMITGRIESDATFSGQNPYWRLMDFGNNSDERITKIRDYTKKKMNSKHFKVEGGEYNDDTLSVGVKNYFIYKRIYVNINVKYDVPFGGILGILGVPNPYPIHAYAEANVSEPAEFIRTLDLGSDVIRAFTGESNKVMEAVQKVINWINKLGD